MALLQFPFILDSVGLERPCVRLTMEQLRRELRVVLLEPDLEQWIEEA
jgi:hypothetical protein